MEVTYQEGQLKQFGHVQRLVQNKIEKLYFRQDAIKEDKKTWVKKIKYIISTQGFQWNEAKKLNKQQKQMKEDMVNTTNSVNSSQTVLHRQIECLNIK